MKIPSELLKESNYDGTRLIEMKDKKVYELQAKLTPLQKEINPIIEKHSKSYYPFVDKYRAERPLLVAQLKAMDEEMQKQTDLIADDVKLIESHEQKATNIKNKIQVLIQKELEGQLSEFEVAKHTVVKDDKIFVEVFDEIEEKIKALRAGKVNKKI